MPESRVRRQDTGLREGQRAAQGHTATVRVPRGVRCPHSPLDPGRGVTLRVQGAWKGLWFAGTSPPPHRRAPRLWGVALRASGLQVLAFGVGSDPPFLPPSSGECLEGAFGAPGPRKLGICSLKSQTSPLTAPQAGPPSPAPSSAGSCAWASCWAPLSSFGFHSSPGPFSQVSGFTSHREDPSNSRTVTSLGWVSPQSCAIHQAPESPSGSPPAGPQCPETGSRARPGAQRPPQGRAGRGRVGMAERKPSFLGGPGLSLGSSLI